ncbi:MAG: diguanylate cyclase [candidate division WOR-3 bacterium]
MFGYKKEDNLRLQTNKIKNKWLWFFISICMVLISGFLDYFTGPEIAFSLIYLIPVAISAWFTKKPFAIVVSIISAATWMDAEIVSGRFYSHVAIHFWNTLTMLGFFLVITLLLDSLKTNLNNEQVLSRIDYLTGVMNPRSFYELMEAEIERCRRYKHPFTIAYFDMDNFKSINDQFGHPVGDDVLRTIAHTIKKNLRKIDAVARLGGDEFVVLLPETDNKDAVRAIKKIREAFIQNTSLKNYSITFSIGVLTCDKDLPNMDKTMKLADSLMYSVKKRGKNGIEYSTYSNFKSDDAIQ